MPKNINQKISSAVLIFANLYPIFGVLFLNWNLKTILCLYSAETIVCYIYIILKIVAIEDPWREKIKSIITTIILTIITVVLLSTFVKGLYIKPEHLSLFDLNKYISEVIVSIKFMVATLQDSWIALLIIIISHAVSFYLNFIKNYEYTVIHLVDLGVGLQKRFLVLFLSFFILGWLVTRYDEYKLAAVAFIIVKLLIDSISHNLAHTYYAQLKKTNP